MLFNFKIDVKHMSSFGLISKITHLQMSAITKPSVSLFIFTITGSSLFSGTAQLLVMDMIHWILLTQAARPAQILTRNQLLNVEFNSNSIFYSTACSKRHHLNGDYQIFYTPDQDLTNCNLFL